MTDATQDKKPKILVVEDDLSILTGLSMSLRFEGFEVIQAQDGRTGLQKAIDERPDLMVLDVMLPQMNGFEVLEVEDHGVGIPRREQKRIFDRFYRVDSLLTRDTEGSGLGLSIAQRIVQAHDGWISVDSVPGRGSTFRIHLPLAQ